MAEKKKTAQFDVRLSQEDLQAWHEAARGQGYRTTAGFVRAAVADAVQSGVKITPEDRDHVYRCLTQLRIVGRNLNVLAHQMNVLAKHPLLAKPWQDRFVLDSDRIVEDSHEVLGELKALMAEFRTLLMRIL